jgi:hypothetical protein
MLLKNSKSFLCNVCNSFFFCRLFWDAAACYVGGSFSHLIEVPYDISLEVLRKTMLLIMYAYIHKSTDFSQIQLIIKF